MPIGAPVGVDAMLKEGAQHLTGLEEAVLKNIQACQELGDMTKTSLGPNGMNKMVINHLERLFVTNDAATMVSELEVAHPAAKMVVLASKQQEAEMGDATNLVVCFAGELLRGTATLLRTGLHVADVVAGYQKGSAYCLEELEKLSCYQVEENHLQDADKLAYAIRTAIGSKQYGWEDVISKQVAEACVNIMPKNPARFNVDNVRVAKILGGGVGDMRWVKGMVLTRDAETTIKHVTKAKVAIYGCEVDIHTTETKGTVLLRSADELMNFHKGEEKVMEDLVKSIKDAGVTCVVSNNKIGELALHFFERYGIMAVKCPSKFELRRICRATGAAAMPKFETPKKEDIGFCDCVTVEEVGSSRCVIFRQEEESSQVATLVLRAATQNVLADIERCIDDAVNVVKAITRDPRMVAGGGACEIELARRVAQYASTCPGMEQYSIRKYAEALEVVARTLATTSGFDATDVIASLYSAHEAGNVNAGVDIDEGTPKDMCEAGVLDHLLTKRWALKFASDAAITVLRVDQIIMAKPAGGPKARDAGGAMDRNDPGVIG